MYLKTDFYIAEELTSAKMKNLDNAVSDTLEELGIAYRVKGHVELDPQNHVRYIVYFVDIEVDNSMLKIEVIDTDESPTICVLERDKFTERSMCRIMDELDNQLTPAQF